MTLVTLQEPEPLPERLDLHGLSEKGSPTSREGTSSLGNLQGSWC